MGVYEMDAKYVQSPSQPQHESATEPEPEPEPELQPETALETGANLDPNLDQNGDQNNAQNANQNNGQSNGPNGHEKHHKHEHNSHPNSANENQNETGNETGNENENEKQRTHQNDEQTLNDSSLANEADLDPLNRFVLAKMIFDDLYHYNFSDHFAHPRHKLVAPGLVDSLSPGIQTDLLVQPQNGLPGGVIPSPSGGERLSRAEGSYIIGLINTSRMSGDQSEGGGGGNSLGTSQSFGETASGPGGSGPGGSGPTSGSLAGPQMVSPVLMATVHSSSSSAQPALAGPSQGRAFWGDYFYSFQTVYWPIHCITSLFVSSVGILTNIIMLIVLTR